MRYEDYDKVLLAAGTLICAMLTIVAGVFETTKPSVAKTAAQSRMRVEQLEPVRIVGTPFVLNTDPSVRVDKD